MCGDRTRVCVDCQRIVPASYSGMSVTCFQDGDGLIQVKAEVVTYIQEEDPLSVTFPAMKTEQGVSSLSVCRAFTDIQLF